MRAALATVALIASMMPATAAATEGLVWAWDGQERRYQIKADVQLADWLVFKKETNSDIRVSQFLVGVTSSCTPRDTIGKSAWEVVCTIEDLQLTAASTRSDAGKLLPILDEIDENLVGARVQMIYGNDGRIRNIDLEGVSKDWRRANEMHETLRLVLARAFAAFDLQLPKKGDDKGRSWRQAGSQVMGFPSEFGSMGQSEIDHQISKTEGSVVEIGSTGRGVVGTGEMITVRTGGPERPRNLFDMSYQGVATFDLADGSLVERQYLVEGTPTASSIAAEGFSGVRYVQAVRLVRIPAGTEAPPLGANAETTRQ